ncbi:hypothetical protein M407DRAFT_32479 [Tulasnella calospora MUT 4182]|uniref:Uncharacterized protein n=1 Tax=Tulasnella calospora MUT 4182 TaxID=1051891 RepID=A0A0C3Q4P1_9AGAM|nr:hypothetical protein M407DRAFT_32479 [Tulasnella calospora MUT 4182]
MKIVLAVERVAAPASPASTTRQRQGNQGTVGAKKSTPLGRTLTRKSVQDPAGGEGPGGKGWVLVNVEPTKKASMDAAVAAMDAAAANARVRNRSTSSSGALNSAAGTVTEGAMMESPVETFSRRSGHVRDNTVDTLDPPVDHHAGREESGPISLMSKRNGSLRKKQRFGSSDDGPKKKRFLGLFSMGSKSKAGGHKKMSSEPTIRTGMMFAEERIGERGEYEVTSPISDDWLDERDDSRGAVDGVKESTWRRVRDPKTPDLGSTYPRGKPQKREDVPRAAPQSYGGGAWRLRDPRGAAGFVLVGAVGVMSRKEGVR